MYLVTLSFDDGFRKSNRRIAEIYERFGLGACFNVMASGTMASDQYGPTPKGDFALWNELSARGHEIMPHGYRHADKSKLSFEEGSGLILKCLETFEEKLKGFERRKAVFNFPYNRTTPQLEAWLPTVVRAFRGGSAPEGINPLPTAQTSVMRTTGMGPENCEAHLLSCLDKLFQQPQGWLVYNTHGLDDEGWGPISSGFLEQLLERLVQRQDVQVIAAGKALASDWVTR